METPETPLADPEEKRILIVEDDDSLRKPVPLNAFTLALHQVLRTQPMKTERSRGLNDRPGRSLP